MADQQNPRPGMNPMDKQHGGNPQTTPPEKGGSEWEGKTERHENRPEVKPGRTDMNPERGGTQGDIGRERSGQSDTGGERTER